MKIFTAEFNEKIIQLYKSGLSCYRIAKILKCSDYKIRGLLLSKNLLKVKKKIQPETYQIPESWDIDEDIKTRIYK